MCKGRGTSKSAAFQELQVKAVQEVRGWKGELGSNMGELEFGLCPTISGTKNVLSLLRFPAVYSCTSEYPVEHGVNGPLGTLLETHWWY